MQDAGVGSRGRPRKWANEAERKRAYRERKAAELAEPLRLRQALAEARAEVAAAANERDRAKEEARRWRRRAEAVDKELQVARERARRARVRAERSTAERDEARRLLRKKLQHARFAASNPLVRDDPQSLLAIIAELYEELDRLRGDNKRFRALLRMPPDVVEHARRRAWREVASD